MATKTFQHKHCDYLGEVFDDINIFQRMVNRTAKEVKRLYPRVTHIAVSGVSGCTVGAAVALKLKKHLIVVRKEGDGSHSRCNVEGYPENVSFCYIILDDFVCDGITVNRIYYSIREENNQAECCGIYQYYKDYRRPYDGYEYLLGIKSCY